ncbi:endonuclease/exonuclease/phosphatase family protein [Marinactinospora rubrisoli]|uniref:Endonuclease/exonuclease/phosphatase family protein n=1 Tax=Marinactinospora rubrisoli TaxID=2715399 RepID=A0ABW2KAU0_9ACTN
MTSGTERTGPLRFTMANVAGGRMLRPGEGDHRYAPEDRTEEFAAAMGSGDTDVLGIAELDCSPGSRQLTALAEPVIGRTGVHLAEYRLAESAVPGVAGQGVGLACRHPLADVERIELPDPPFPLLHWRTGEELPWHTKGLLVARLEPPGDDRHLDVGIIHTHPVHMARDAKGVEHSYERGPGREFGQATAEFVAARLAARGADSIVLMGDMNNCSGFFRRIGDRELVDVFGARPPATTPDGRCIDRALVTGDLRVAGRPEVIRLAGADHFPVRFRLESPTGPTKDAEPMDFALKEAPPLGRGRPGAPNAAQEAARHPYAGPPDVGPRRAR